MSDFEETLRHGGPQADVEDDAARKAQEREAKKAEVRKRLEEAGNKKKSKKGFLTPERKKKLRKLLMMKAAEDLKQQQLMKEQERSKALQSRTMALPNVDSIEDKGKLEQIFQEIQDRVFKLEEEKWDINYLVSTTESEINELTIAVNDLRGKFVKPSLKKVSKYENKFKMMAKDPAKVGEKQDFRSNLKVVKKENAIEDIMAKTQKKENKPDWSKKPAATEEVKEEKKEEVKEEEPVAEAEPAEEPETEEVEEEEEEEEEEE